MKIDGGCHCGEITFEAEVDPNALYICHCTDCQTLSGSAFRANILAPAEHFVLLSGTPKTYINTNPSRSSEQYSARAEKRANFDYDAACRKRVTHPQQFVRFFAPGPAR